MILVNNKKWTEAPPFVYRPETEWPEQFKALTPKEAELQRSIDEKELAPERLVAAVQRKFKSHIELPDLPEKTRSWLKICRITAFVFRFLLKKVPSLKARTALFSDAVLGSNGTLKTSEIAIAQIYWIRTQQRASFCQDIATEGDKFVIREGSSIEPLAPFFDSSNCIRVQTRACRSEKLPSFTSKPILVPPRNPLMEK